MLTSETLKPISQIEWGDIDLLREKIARPGAKSVEGFANQFAAAFSETVTDLVLVRVFLVLPFVGLPPGEQQAAIRVAGSTPIQPGTRILSLMATRGRKPEWNDRHRSAGHRAIPLLNRAFVEGAPMIAKLLSELEVDLAGLDDGRPIATRKMLGGHNGTFVVPDASTARDDQGRFIIAAEDFVRENQVKTVFGMGGAYADGTLAVAIVFTNELLPRLQVDRFPSLISNFKMVSAGSVASRHIFDR